MAKIALISLIIMLYVHYCFGLPTNEEIYYEDEVCFFGKKGTIILNQCFFEFEKYRKKLD